MQQYPPYVRLRRLLSLLRLPGHVLHRAWHAGNSRVSNAMPHIEALTTPLSTYPVVCFSAGLLGGSMLGTSMTLTPTLMGTIVLVGGLLCLRWLSPSIRRCCRLFFVGLLLTHLPVLWQARALPTDHIVRVLTAQPGRPVTVEGTLDRAVEARGDRQRLYLRLHRLRRQQQDWQSVSGRVRINVHAMDVPFLPGDVIRIERLRLYSVRGLLNPKGFNFQEFMHRQGIYALGGVSNPTRIHLQHRPEGFQLARSLERWRHLLQAKVRTSLAPPYDAVFLALVLGHRGALPVSVQQSFQAAGAAHLLVVSGLHVGFVAAVLLLGWRTLLRLVRGQLPPVWLPGWRPTPLAVLLSLPPLVLYCSLVGWKVPTTRAALMVGSSLGALALSRPHSLPHALILAAALILLLDPTAVFTIGFQLSFVAVVCILLMSRALLSPGDGSSVLRRWGRRLWVYLLISSAAYLGTLPIIASNFHTIPSFGILTNVLLVPLAGVLVPLGVVALSLLAVWPAWGAVVCSLLAPFLAWMVSVADTMARLPGAQLHLAAPSVPMLCGYYGLLGSLLLRPLQGWRLPLAAGCVVLLLAGTTWQYIETRVRQLQVTFLDVGSGDAILVQVPGHHSLLIDGGGTYDGRFDIGARVIAPVLWDRYVHGFEFMAMTHPQANHARGLVSLLRLFPTKHLFTNGTPLTADYLRDLLAIGRRRGTQHHTALDGARRWRWGRLHLDVLAPPSTAEQQHTAWNPPTENDRSLVLRLQYGAVRLLLTGDIQHATERWLLTHGADLRADILQVPHHGSRTSTSLAFVQRVRPQVGIISLGAGNPYGHPHPRVLRVLASQHVCIFRTDYHGAITITSDGTQYRVMPLRPYQVSVASAHEPAR
jgi:competence protein ComEC